MDPHASLAGIRSALEPHADPEAGADMRRYLRDLFPFLGVTAPVRRSAQKPLLAASADATADELLDLADALWAQPEREFAYVACDLLRKRVGVLGPEHLPRLRHLVATDGWWDTVDQLAANIIGVLIREHRALAAEMDRWIDDPDLWIRRTAILHQLTWKDQTDVDRLARYCEAQLADPDFFIRKSIGWALRQYARTDPDWVRAFVDDHPGLSPLSRREALKHLG